ncbi:unnamed protein product [Arabidopsis halleri]
MCYYSSSEEDEPDYLHFRKLLNFPLVSGFAAKHTTLKTCSTLKVGVFLKVLQNQQIKRMCYYSSSEEDEPGYLHFRKLLNFPLASGFAAKHTNLKTCSTLKVLQNQQIRRMCYYFSSEEDEPDYLHFRKLLNFPLASGFAAKHTTLKTCSTLKVLQNQQIRRMCYYSSSEEEDPDYLHFRNLLNFPLSSGFAAKHTTFFREVIGRDPSVLMEEGTVWKLIHGVVVPNILIRPEDEDLFESDYRGFINREMDSESRRRGACILFGRMVRGCEEARAVSFEEVIKLVESRDWKEKECGILLAATMVGSPTALLDTRKFKGSPGICINMRQETLCGSIRWSS